MARSAERVGPAELRARRVASAALGIALLVYTAADLVTIWGQPTNLSHWWWIVSLAGRLAFGVVLLTVPWFASAAVLRVLALSFVAFGVVTVSISLIAVNPELTWVLRAQSLYVWAAPLAMRPPEAWAWILVFESLAAAARAIRVSDPFQFLESTLVALTMTVLLVSVLMVFLRMTRARDLRERLALRAIREDAYQAARTAELRRIERIVHDEVLSTLRAAGLGLVTARADPARLAGAALEHLAVLDQRPDEADAPVEVGALLNRLRSLVTTVAPETEVRVVQAGAPVDRGVSRVVRARIGPDAIEVTVEDDGDSFDVRHVPPHRLGIARSIVERMRALPGGDARVLSRARSGTSVTLSWRG